MKIIEKISKIILALPPCRGYTRVSVLAIGREGQRKPANRGCRIHTRNSIPTDMVGVAPTIKQGNQKSDAVNLLVAYGFPDRLLREHEAVFVIRKGCKMSLRFRKSVNLGRGVKLNLSKSGISTSLGGRGHSVNIGRGGVRGAVGIPGIGLSYRRELIGSGESAPAGYDVGACKDIMDYKPSFMNRILKVIKLLGFVLLLLVLIIITMAAVEMKAPWLAGIPWFFVLVAVIKAIKRRKRQKKYNEEMLACAATTRELVRKHFKALSAKYKQCTYLDDYGKPAGEADFDKELAYFVERVIVDEIKGLTSFIDIGFITLIARHEFLEMCAGEPSSLDKKPKATSGIDYEKLICVRLKDLGFNAHTTKASGDQGVDVLADKGGVSFAIQCKMYSQPVGNAAVQEVNAGRDFYKRDYGVVVSTADFTKSARQAANACGIILLNENQLEKLLDYTNVQTGSKK